MRLPPRSWDLDSNPDTVLPLLDSIPVHPVRWCVVRQSIECAMQAVGILEILLELDSPCIWVVDELVEVLSLPL